MSAQLLSIPQAAEQLGVSRIRVWQWVKGERLPAVRLGNFWFINPADLASFAPRKPGRPRKDRACA